MRGPRHFLGTVEYDRNFFRATSTITLKKLVKMRYLGGIGPPGPGLATPLIVSILRALVRAYKRSQHNYEGAISALRKEYLFFFLNIRTCC